MRVLAIALMLFPGLCASQPGGFLTGSVGVTQRDDIDEHPFFPQNSLKYSDGTTLSLEGGAQLTPSFAIRGGFQDTRYDELTVLNLLVEKDIELQEWRAGAYFAPIAEGRLNYRVGGGIYYSREAGSQANYDQKGGFVEGALMPKLGQHATGDLALTLMHLDGEDGASLGAELRLGVTFHTGLADVVPSLRRFQQTRDGAFDDGVWEFRLGVGATWG